MSRPPTHVYDGEYFIFGTIWLTDIHMYILLDLALHAMPDFGLQALRSKPSLGQFNSSRIQSSGHVFLRVNGIYYSNLKFSERVNTY